ncbi:MAG: glycerol kinase GlpK [Pseudomonadota bacterium]|nr:glycerol kinase [Pseudomonadota bacterium]QKK05597.1 MAG: glycerol kinase GlpK [Pseudomonadota bacterium]
MKDYILAIDQGTTSTRAVLFNRDAQAVSFAQKELKLVYPQNGWVEQDPHDIWRDTKSVCRKAIDSAEISPEEIAAIGVTNQRETVVLWNKHDGTLIGPAIVWQDRRTADYCRELKAEGHEETFRNKTGLLLDPYFSGTKLSWLLNTVEGAREAAERGDLLCGTVDTYILWRMTGATAHVTDATNASRTLLYNIVEGCWDDELLKILNLPRKMFPEVKDSSGLFGMSAEKFLGIQIPVTGIAGDQQAAFVGQACFDEGMMKSTYGTGCFALMNIGGKFRTSKHKLLTTIAYQLDGKVTYALEGSIFIAGAAVQWLRDGLQIIAHAAKSEEIAKRIPHNGGVYMVPAFTGLGAPYWDPDARGAIFGVTRDTTLDHIVRAALEAQAYQTCDLMGAMLEDSGTDITEIRVDGGMVENNWMCQFLADMTNCDVNRPQVIETTALGAAYLAGLAVGFYESPAQIARNWRLSRSFKPRMDDKERQELYAGWKDAISRILTQR